MITSKKLGTYIFGALVALVSITVPILYVNKVYVPANVETSATSTVERIIVKSYTGATTTQRLCSIQNVGGVKLLTDVALRLSTSTNTGGSNPRITISLSSSASATGTGSNLLYDNNFALPTTASSTLTTTSTLQSAYSLWYTNQYLNFFIDSPTNTITGDCYTSYMYSD